MGPVIVEEYARLNVDGLHLSLSLWASSEVVVGGEIHNALEVVDSRRGQSTKQTDHAPL